MTAVDFLEDCIATNQVENSKFDNIKFVTSDVMDLEVDKSSVDAVFSNWLFMYLNDSEVLDLLRKADLWVRPQGERREEGGGAVVALAHHTNAPPHTQ